MQEVINEVTGIVVSGLVAMLTAVIAILTNKARAYLQEKVTETAVGRLVDAAARQVAMEMASLGPASATAPSASFTASVVDRVVDNLTANLPDAVARSGSTQEGLSAMVRGVVAQYRAKSR